MSRQTREILQLAIAIQQGEKTKHTQGAEGIDQGIEHGAGKTTGGARDCTQQEEAHVGNGGVGEQALDACLHERDDVPEQHGSGSQQDQHGLPDLAGQGFVEQAHDHGIGSEFGYAGDEQGDWQGGTIIDIGHPGVEGEGAEFEGDTGHNEADAEPLQPGTGGHGVHQIQLDLAGGAVEEGESVEQQAGGQGTQHEVLHGGLGGIRPTMDGHHGIKWQGQQLQSQIDGEEAVRGHQHQGPQHGVQPEHIVLAVVAGLQVAVGVEEGQGREDEDTGLQHGGHGIHNKMSVETHAVAGDEDQRQGDDQAGLRQGIGHRGSLIAITGIREQHPAACQQQEQFR